MVSLERTLRLIRQRLSQGERFAVEHIADEMERTMDAEDRDLTAGLRDHLTTRTRRLAAAMERAKAGEYGLCSSCGQRIASKRLKALPDADLCLVCQQEHERGERG